MAAEALIIFAKAPSPGRVKTRLSPLLSENQAAQLQKALILDTLGLAASLPVQHVLACAPDFHHPFFRQCAKRFSLLLLSQKGDDLGERMKNAFAWGFESGFSKIVLIGSDTPTLPIAFIREAFLRLNSFPVVLGPSLDGGYYLIGANKPLIPPFCGLLWGTRSVSTETLRKLNEKKIRCHLLPFWYDIDRPEDLSFLREHLTILKGEGAPIPQKSRQVIGRIASSIPDNLR